MIYLDETERLEGWHLLQCVSVIHCAAPTAETLPVRFAFAFAFRMFRSGKFRYGFVKCKTVSRYIKVRKYIYIYIYINLFLFVQFVDT